ncbi:GFA family protein [Nocardia gipuzkoensis]
MAWVGFPGDRFAWTGPGGEPQWYKSFPTTKRGFCPNCGSTAAALDEGSDDIGITMMALDDHSHSLVPVHQSFKHHAVPWLPAIESVGP